MEPPCRPQGKSKNRPSLKPPRRQHTTPADLVALARPAPRSLTLTFAYDESPLCSTTAMAPMLLTVDHELPFELAFAPHMLKVDAKTTTSDTMEPEAEIAIPQKCQICFDDCVDEATTVTKFCGASCPAVLCRDCLAEHLRLSVAEAFPGVLPRVRCPVCLKRVGKATWQHIASGDVVTQYVTACRTACSFQTPCCHDPTYTHLPGMQSSAYPSLQYTRAREFILASKKSTLALLKEQTRRFCEREISAKDWIIFLEDAFGRRVKKLTLVFEHELVDIMDEERRATLLLAYHAKYKIVVTRCCQRRTCFNCKREVRYHTNGVCDEDPIVADCIIECRSCHVTMVKVEGCSAATCWCGFQMDWDAELQTRDKNKRRLIPVDVYDITAYETWVAWHHKFLNILTTQLLPKRHALRLSFINQQLSNTQGLRTTLQRLLRGPFIWRRHFRRGLPKMEQEMVQARMRMLATRLRKAASFVLAVGRAKWRCRFTKAVPQLTKELADRRMLRCTTRLTKSPSFVEAVRRAKWRAHWTQVVCAIHAKQFWIAHKRENHAEPHVLESDELALLLPSFPF